MVPVALEVAVALALVALDVGAQLVVQLVLQLAHIAVLPELADVLDDHTTSSLLYNLSMYIHVRSIWI